MAELVYPEESYRIIGACFNVYNDKGHGFLEPVYQECLEIELQCQDIPFVPQKKIALTYRGQMLKHTYEPDFVCFDKIVVEIKAVSGLANEHRAQLLNYLNAAEMKLGLLVNFGCHPKLEYERMVMSGRKQEARELRE